MTTKLYRAAEVCELLQVQAYVLRSWEKEFPGIGIQKSAESPRLYRQSDVEHVQRIKQLVFGEGLTVAGVRRRLEETAPIVAAMSESEAAEVLEALGDEARERIAFVRDRLRELQSMLAKTPGASNGHGRGVAKASRRAAVAPKRPASKTARPKARAASARNPARTSSSRTSSSRSSSSRNSSSRTKPAKRASAKAASAARKKTTSKRKHART